MDKIWKSRQELKDCAFQSCYRDNPSIRVPDMGTNSIRYKQLNGMYTCVLRKVKNLLWKDKADKKTIYGNLKPITLMDNRNNWKCIAGFRGESLDQM